MTKILVETCSHVTYINTNRQVVVLMLAVYLFSELSGQLHASAALAIV
jgi:hypothetical protein